MFNNLCKEISQRRLYFNLLPCNIKQIGELFRSMHAKVMNFVALSIKKN